MDEIYFKLKNPKQEEQFVQTLFKNRIPHEIYCRDIIGISIKNKLLLEEKGFELDIVERPINLSELSLEERNKIKSRSRATWRAKRDAVIYEFLSEYGTE